MMDERSVENPNGPPVAGTEVEATPEEENILASAVEAATQYIHGEMRESIVQEVQQGDPIEAISQISYGLLTKMQQQQQLPMDIMQELAAHVVEMVAEIADASGAVELNEQVIQQSYLEVVRLHGQSMEGNPDAQAEAQSAMAGMDPGATEAAMNEMMGMNPMAAGVKGGLAQYV